MRKFTLFLAAICCCAMMNAVNYSLTIAGTTVTDVNKTDVLGDGKVSFDPATNTLTLNNATIQTTGNSAIIWSDFASTLTIMLKGTNNYIAISGVSDYTGAIHTMGRLLITSEENPSSVAELKIITSGTDGAPAIWSYSGDIIIENPISVNLQGAGNGAGTIYSQTNGNLIIDGATFYMMPCRIRTAGTVIARSAITAPSDAVLAADGRIMRSGTSSEYSKTTQVVISSNLRRLIYEATPKNVGNKVKVNDNPSTASQAYAWIELADYINLTATPAEGYTFTGWYNQNNQLLSTENPYTNQLMTENTTLIYGQFEEDTPPAPVDEDRIIVDGIYYQLDRNNQTAVVTYETQNNNNYKDLSAAVSIPETIREGITDFTVVSVGDSAFINAKRITSLTLPNTVTRIGNYAFYGCKGLTSFTIPENVRTIGYYSFAYCSGLTVVVIPDGVDVINSYAFIYCDEVISVTIGSGLSKLDDSVFRYSNKLESFQVSENNRCFSTIDGVLCNKTKTKIVYFPYARSGAYTIPDDVYIIGEGAFAFSSLTSITMGPQLLRIDAFGLSLCKALSTIICHAVTPPLMDIKPFYGTECDEILLYVPAESIEAYREAEYWKEFVMILPISEGIDNEKMQKYENVKFIKDGQLFIERNGKTYNVQGASLK